jgi:serine/threonine protein kinase
MRIKQVKQKGKKIDDEILFEWCDEIIEALKFLKEKRIIHRDIKSK